MAWHGKVAQLGPVGDIDEQSARLEAGGDRFGFVEGHEGEPRLRIVLGHDYAAGPLDQPPLGLTRVTLAQHDHRLAGNSVEQGEAMQHQSSQAGTRSAEVIASGRIRSATTAN